MGDIADDHIEQMLADGVYPFSRPRRPKNPRCIRCGTVCKWRVNGAGNWQLFNIKRGEHNRFVPHVCAPTTAYGFEAPR